LFLQDLVRLLRNAVIINVYSWVDYFVLSFLFENRSYVDIMTVFKEENKDKRIYPRINIYYYSIPYLQVTTFNPKRIKLSS